VYVKRGVRTDKQKTNGVTVWDGEGDGENTQNTNKKSLRGKCGERVGV